jgi:hypothetical protein
MSILFSALFDASENLKVKWKEPYVSEALNLKMAVNTPRGFYRGFRLAAHADPLTVTVAADTDGGDSIAVYEVGAGDTAVPKYAITIRKTGNIALDLTTAAGTTVYICLFATYIVGSTTSANMRAYTAAEFAALSAALRGELLILGTVVVPGSGVIPAANITMDHRTNLFETRTPEASVWKQLVTNGGFEWGKVDEVGASAVPGWLAFNSSCTWRITQNPSSGQNGLTLNMTSTTSSGLIVQELGYPCLTGQAFKTRIHTKNLKISSGGSLKLTAVFSKGTDQSTQTTVDVVTLPTTAVDGSFQVTEAFFVVPATYYVLERIEIKATGYTVASTGDAIHIDNVQVWAEPLATDEGPQAPGPQITPINSRVFTLESTIGALAAQDAVTLTLDGSTVVHARRDESTTATNQPSIKVPGIITVGTNLINTDARAATARLVAPARVPVTPGDIARTGLWTSAGETYGVTYYRVSNSGYEFVERAFNCTYSGTAWSCTDAAFDAYVERSDGRQYTVYRKAGTGSTWNDTVGGGGWDVKTLDIQMVSASGNLLDFTTGTVSGAKIKTAQSGVIHASRTVMLSNFHSVSNFAYAQHTGLFAWGEFELASATLGSAMITLPIPDDEVVTQVRVICGKSAATGTTDLQAVWVKQLLPLAGSTTVSGVASANSTNVNTLQALTLTGSETFAPLTKHQIFVLCDNTASIKTLYGVEVTYVRTT